MSQETEWSDDSKPRPQETVYSDETPADLKAAEAGVAEDWKEGDVILDLYEVKSLLGEGGMGRVYRVHHKNWNIDLAVKTPRVEVITRAGGKENFVREAETWVNLGLHPHTVSCYYVRDLGGIPRIFAEYVEGGSLSDWIRTRKLYEGGPEEALKRILDIAIQFAWGLHYAHEQGLVHQDVKPANVMMTPEGVAKVTDFGLSQARAVAGELEKIGDTPGRSIVVAGVGLMTPAYASPEQSTGSPLTRKTDTWSWAASVLEMFAGGLFWLSGTTADESLDAYLDEWSEAEGLPRMPAEISELLHSCFRQSPDERPQDMLAISNVLQEIYRQLNGEAYPRQIPRESKTLADRLNNRAASLLDLGKGEEAERLWQEALKVQPQHGESTYNLALAEWRSGRISDLEVLTRLKEIRNPDTVIYDGGPQLAMDYGDYWTRRVEDWVNSHWQALVQIERDDCEEAIKLLEEIKQDDGNREEVSAALKKARRRLKLRSLGGPTDPEPAPFPILSRVLTSSDQALSYEAIYDSEMELGQQALSSGDEIEAGRHFRKARSQPGYSRMPEAIKAWSQLYVRLLRQRISGWWRAPAFGDSGVTSICLSYDNCLALTGGDDGKLKLWELDTGRCVRTFEGHPEKVNCVCLSQNGLYALSGSEDQTFKLWGVETGECLRTFAGNAGGLIRVGLSFDGRLAFSLSSISGTSKAHLKLWEVGTGRCLRTREEDFKDFCLSQDGLYVMAVSGGDFSLLDIATDKYLRTYTKEEYSTESICLSPDGRYALWCGQMGYKSPTPKLTLWDATTGNAIRDFEGHTDQVVSACLSSDGRYAFSGSKDGTIKLWETSTGKCLHTLPTSAIDSLCVSRDGRYLVSTGSSGCQRLILDWDLAGLDLEDIMPPSAKPYIETFLIQHTPYAAALPAEGEPTAKEIELSLTHEGKAVWTEDDLQDLFYALGCAGMGYIEKAQDFLLKDLWTDDDISTLLWKRQKVEEQNREDEREGEQRARLEELKKSGALKEAGQRAVRDASLRGVAPIDVLKQELLRLGLDENLVLTAQFQLTYFDDDFRQVDWFAEPPRPWWKRIWKS